ncbi:hypothetical protein, partial [Salmonella enterica]
SFPVNAWPDWSALSALSKSKGWDMCHSFLIVYYWNDTEFLTLPDLPPDTIKLPRNVLSILLPTFPITLLSVRLPHCLKGYLRSYH